MNLVLDIRDLTRVHGQGESEVHAWLLVLGLVIGLPLLTAGVVGAATRSRMPIVRRMS
jgi:ABC-type amino acid transport system permease subunit